MEVIRHLHNLRPRHRGCVAAIGSFDGVHLGHRAMLERVVAAGRARALPAALVTFEPQPREFFGGDRVPARLTRFREKMAVLGATGLDRVLILRFDRALADMEPEPFVREVLVDGLGVRELVVGDDFRFGHRARGDAALLESLGPGCGFDVSRVATLDLGGERVSSSRVRAAVAAGDFALAARLLGRAYAVCGRVRSGRRLGRGMGFPTANLDLARQVSALGGVYAVRVRGLEAPACGMANVGTRPTVSGGRPLLEVHLFDFSGDIYGREIGVEFVERLRAERRFESLDALVAQLRRDALDARRVLNRAA